ncbi:MAG: hypothetical protein MI861_18370 [Pirellulales bacterium]|nr:hypothetical protein [Pirellulales bacterium]
MMRFGNVRYTILQLMLFTVLVALYYVALVNESPWWRATLMTICLCLFLNSIIASIVARGERQSFALGYMMATFFYLFSLYASFGIETLPLLLTQSLWANIVVMGSEPPSEEHFYVIAGMFWSQMFSFSGGALALRWYRHRLRLASDPATLAG